MATKTSDFQLRMSGGASNTNPLNSLGGAMSSALVTAALFDPITPIESAAGRKEYRLGYFRNNRSTTIRNARAWIKVNTPQSFTKVEIGLGVSGRNGTEPAIATEGAVPSGVQFSSAQSLEQALPMGDIPGGQGYPVWFRWDVSAGAPAINPDSFTFEIDGDYEE